MPQFSESRRSLVLGAIGIALTGCGKREQTHSETRYDLDLPGINISVPERQPVPQKTEPKPKAVEYFYPWSIRFPGSQTELAVKDGVMSDDGVLEIPDGGNVLDFSRKFPKSKNTMVITGHSTWMDELCPMGLTFDFKRNDVFTVRDVMRGQVNFGVEKLLALDWDGTYDVINQERKEGTAVMFTSLRTDSRQDYKHLLQPENVIQRVDNPFDLESLYGGQDYLYWVTVASQRPFAAQPEVF